MQLLKYAQQVDEINESSQPKQWYETLWGLVIITIGLNVFSNFIYEKGREQIRLRDQKRQRNIDFLKKYEGESAKQAEESEQQETNKLDKQEAEGDFN